MSDPVPWIAVLAGASLLPFCLMATTSFIKIAVVLGLLRPALGAPQIPPGSVVVILAAALSLSVMAPVGRHAWDRAQPHVTALVDAEDPAHKRAALERSLRAIWGPLATFMQRQVREADLARFQHHAQTDRDDPRALIPAFVVSELGAAFRIGFLVALPFLLVDLVVASVLMALGMQMMAPTTVSLPLKLLVFTSVDGWSRLASALMRTYA